MDRRDYNFKDFRPMIFSTIAEVGLDDGKVGKATAQINDKPFILEMVTHQKMGPVTYTATEGYEEFQDGLYTIDWSLYNQDRYWQGVPPMADAAFGSARTGIWIPLRAPIALEKSRTINVAVQNVGAKIANYKVMVLFHGVEDYRPRDREGNLIDAQGNRIPDGQS